MSHPPRPSDDSTIARGRRAGRVALVGRANVGKSTLLNALVGEPLAITSRHPQTTRDAVRGICTAGATQIVFVDTPGVHEPRTRLGRRMNDVAREQAREADALVLVVEAPREPTSSPAPHPADVALAADLPEAPVVLAVSKVDRLGDKSVLLPFIAAFCAARPFAATVPLSARRHDGLDRLVAEVAPMLPEQPWPYEPETLSDQPERFFVAEIVREQILRHTRQEVPHGIAVEVERFDDSVEPARIAATIHVARAGHTKIVVGAGGAMLKAIGTASRARVERLIGRRVHLGLRVRATPGWMDDEARLRDLGYGADP